MRGIIVEKENENEDLLRKFNLMFEELRNEINHRDAHIVLLGEDYRVLEEEAVMAEQSLTKKLEHQNRDLGFLREKIKKLEDEVDCLRAEGDTNHKNWKVQADIHVESMVCLKRERDNFRRELDNLRMEFTYVEQLRERTKKHSRELPEENRPAGAGLVDIFTQAERDKEKIEEKLLEREVLLRDMERELSMMREDRPPTSKEIHGKVRVQKPTGDVRVGPNVNLISDMLVPVLTEERENEGTDSEETLGVDSGGEPERGTEIMNRGAEELCRKPKITVIGDQYAKSFRGLFGDLGRESKYHIQTTIKGNIEMATLARSVFSEIKNHDGEDYVFFVFKTRNIDNTRTVNMALRYLLPISKFTNLTIVAE
ncbi:hypothetical protein HHI36_001911, partial [Cryptolaemus montrouzieri]